MASGRTITAANKNAIEPVRFRGRCRLAILALRAFSACHGRRVLGSASRDQRRPGPPLWTPIVFAALHTNASCSAATRRVAWAFLAAVAFGAIVAHEQRLFPALGGVDRRLGIVQDRVLTWYVGVYAFWACVVLPSHLFMGSLRNHRRGTPAAFSRFTFYLGLGAVILMCIGLPSVLGLLGFWPAL
jgi:hypothetical protein